MGSSVEVGVVRRPEEAVVHAVAAAGNKLAAAEEEEAPAEQVAEVEAAAVQPKAALPECPVKES